MDLWRKRRRASLETSSSDNPKYQKRKGRFGEGCRRWRWKPRVRCKQGTKTHSRIMSMVFGREVGVLVLNQLEDGTVSPFHPCWATSTKRTSRVFGSPDTPPVSSGEVEERRAGLGKTSPCAVPNSGATGGPPFKVVLSVPMMQSSWHLALCCGGCVFVKIPKANFKSLLWHWPHAKRLALRKFLGGESCAAGRGRICRGGPMSLSSTTQFVNHMAAALSLTSIRAVLLTFLSFPVAHSPSCLHARHTFKNFLAKSRGGAPPHVVVRALRTARRCSRLHNRFHRPMSRVCSLKGRPEWRSSRSALVSAGCLALETVAAPRHQFQNLVVDRGVDN